MSVIFCELFNNVEQRESFPLMCCQISLKKPRVQHEKSMKVAHRRQIFLQTTVELWFRIASHYLQLFTNHLFKMSAQIKHNPQGD
jgi:hypothetical protein